MRLRTFNHRHTANVWITGDQTIDWAVKPNNPYLGLNPDDRLHVKLRLLWHAGGVFQLESLIGAALREPPRRNSRPIYCAKIPDKADLKAYGSGLNHSFAVLGDYKGKSGTVQRVSEFIGFRANDTELDPGTVDFTAVDKMRDADVIVIDDAGLGFRSNEQYWRRLIARLSERSDSLPWLVLKISHKVKDSQGGKFWREVLQLAENNAGLKKKLIVLTSAARLRDAQAEISRDLSWDQTVNDLLYEVDNHSEFSTLRACPRLIVSFGPSGVIILDRDQNGPTDWNLVYNHKLMEREWLNTHRDGMMFGYGSILCSALVAELVSKQDDVDYANAMKQGLVAMQRLYEEGFSVPPEGDTFSLPEDIFRQEESELLRDLRIHPDSTPSPTPNRNACTILPDPSTDLARHEAVLFRIARRGKEELEGDQPVTEYGKLVTADRGEIESLRAIYNLIDNYRKPNFDAKPLAIAVFGSPGSGKGFTVRQVAHEWVESGLLKPLEFNLSEFSSPSELVGALDQIRDVALGGQVPLVLWDEFDSTLNGGLGWLKYFLGPIQDGRFQQEEKTHLIGPAIFVFAGGTSESFEEFSAAVNGDKNSKGPDFLSRLRGYISIPGIDSSSADGPPEPKLMLRRALILSSMFGDAKVGKKTDGFDVNDGVLDAFLTVPQYEHGARSMQAIIAMSKFPKHGRYDRSALPSRDQLKLHVKNADKFLDIMRGHADSY
ncbi:hypothetical protein ABZ612_20530 [Streptomyces avermitilis]|uniref:hypothetical protein n=1 Tax=Streptomyces avermitilis TaxID=33903 RepID=UPI0033E2EE30